MDDPSEKEGSFCFWIKVFIAKKALKIRFEAAEKKLEVRG